MLRHVCRKFSTGRRQLIAAAPQSQTGSSSTSGGPNVAAIVAAVGAAGLGYYAYQTYYSEKYSAGPTHIPPGMTTKSGPNDTTYVKNEHDNTKADTGPNYIASSNAPGKTDGSDTRRTVDQGSA